MLVLLACLSNATPVKAFLFNRHALNYFLYIIIKTTMTITIFKEGMAGAEPPPNVSIYLQALWYDANDDWERAHKLIQDLPDKNAAWIHAYLHRREGDLFNADYWYRRAGKSRPDVSLAEEWEGMVSALL